MSFQVYSSDNIPAEKWAELSNNSIYSAPSFARLWRTMGGKEIFAVLQESGEFIAGMAGVLFGRYPLMRYQSMAHGIYGGPFFRKGTASKDKNLFLEYFVRWMRSRMIIKADIHNPMIDFKAYNFTDHTTSTHKIILKDRDYKPPSQKISEHIRTGKRRSADVYEFTELNKIGEFYELVKSTHSKHKTEPRYPKVFFEKLFELAGQNPRVLWWNVKNDDRIIGSRICLVEGDELLTWQYYSERQFNNLKPGYLLLDHIIGYALRNDIKTVNLGWSPPDAHSLIDYKERWGGQITAFKCYTYYNLLGRLLYRWSGR